MVTNTLKAFIWGLSEYNLFIMFKYTFRLGKNYMQDMIYKTMLQK